MLISLIGMSGAGKSSVGSELCARMKAVHPNTLLIDGDELRAAIAPDLAYTFEDRRESEARRSKLCKYLSDQGMYVICAGLSNYPEWRAWCKKKIAEYFEVYLDVPLAVLQQRDSKGIYRQAADGQTRNVVGVDIPFAPPAEPDLVVDNADGQGVKDVVELILHGVALKFASVELTITNKE
jgi:adenylylsulfate kinase-like enzyme